MHDQDIIKKLQTLRAIKPNEDWVFSTRQQILMHARQTHQEQLSIFNFQFPKLLFQVPSLKFQALSAVTVAVFVLAVVVGAAQNSSLPGDALYPVKLVIEGAQSAVPADQSGKAQLQAYFTVNRVEELARLAQKEEYQKVQAPITERVESYKKELESAKKSLAELSGSAESEEMEKVAQEVDVIKESAQTLTIALRQTTQEVDLAEVLRATVANRLVECTDVEVISEAQILLATGEVASLIEANELTVRCQENS